MTKEDEIGGNAAGGGADVLKLLCPFCGGEAELIDIEEGENAGGSCVCCMTETYPGMTLRDWFAGQALSGLVMKDPYADPERQAHWAYVIADAMLAKRGATHG